MKTRLPRGRIDQQRAANRPDASPTADVFPPLTTSLGSFVKNGSDREFRQLIYDLIRLSNQLARNRSYFAGYVGVTDAQWLMMMIIAEERSATVGDLAQQLNVTSQFVTIEINNLVNKNIVVKRPNETDRRSVILNLTPKGKNLLHEASPMVRTANDIMFRSLTTERAKVFKEMVSTLTMDGAIALHELEAPHWRNTKAPSAEAVRPFSRKMR